MNNLQTTQRITFTAIATILIPFGVAQFSVNIVAGLILVVLGIVSLTLRELFKSV